MDEAGEREIANAVAEARRAGVDEAEIDAVLRREIALDDGFTPIIIASRLHALATGEHRGHV